MYLIYLKTDLSNFVFKLKKAENNVKIMVLDKRADESELRTKYITNSN